MSKKMLAKLATLSAVPVIVVGVGTPASAANQNVNLTVNSVLRGSLYFYEDGDRFGLWDDSADGYGTRAYVEYWRNPAVTYYPLTSWSNGTGARSVVYKTVDLNTSDTYRMKVCTTGDAGATIKCSSWKYFQASS
ncbi:hypothetical protein IAG44_25535 [Streptomyces roseirectus]|uniref:Uncharacterized protein n=1 Tax=Streptomyces roseirectus TaxID=2768066 RepID=A0A7H0II35_9ACTN|nr:hypothetical protein [Streptomyces roseirectus]QNP72451.1 hypothetical protein IAG44_25535 [Streptomyces roseirectus]